MDFELEVSWWDMQSNSSCNRVRSAVVHEFVQVVNILTQLSELNSVVLVVTKDTSSERSSELNINKFTCNDLTCN